MPRNNVPSDSSLSKVCRAFKKIGFLIKPGKYGKGSHTLVQDPKTGMSITVQHKIYKQVLVSYCQEVEKLGYDVNKFIKYL